MQAFLQEVGSELAADAPKLSAESLAQQMNVAGGPTESPWPKSGGGHVDLELPVRCHRGGIGQRGPSRIYVHITKMLFVSN